MAVGPDIDSVQMESYVLPLRRILGELKPKNVLDIGIGYDAYSTRVWLEDGNVQLTCVDKEDWGGWVPRLSENPRFSFVRGRSEEVLPTLVPRKYDLIYIDGDHAYRGVRDDILNSMNLVSDGVILIDDYGVELSAIDIVDGVVQDGYFGIKQAVDELFDDSWEQVYQHLNFGNGAVAWRRR